MRKVLFPVLVHCYLDLVERHYVDEAVALLDAHAGDLSAKHAADIRALRTVRSDTAVAENSVAVNLRSYRYTLSLSSYAFELLLIFLHEASFKLILSLLNRYVQVQVYAGQPSDAKAGAAFEGVTGADAADVVELNQRPIHWGLYDEQKALFGVADDAAQAMAADGDDDAGDDAGDDGAGGDNAADDADADADDKAKKSGKKRGRQSSKAKAADASDAPPTPLPVIDVTTQTAMLADAAKRAKLSSTALPSIAFFTFLHSHESLNCVALSDDGSMVVGGFADSSAKLWNMREQVFDEADAQERADDDDDDKPPFRKLIGHSGPIYGASISPDNHWLLTSSEDATARLWSTETGMAVCSYAEHNYPVWDVSFAPHGYYFATASHDRTARVWSTDRLRSLRTLVGHLSDVNTVKFHPNCSYVASGSSDKCGESRIASGAQIPAPTMSTSCANPLFLTAACPINA